MHKQTALPAASALRTLATVASTHLPIFGLRLAERGAGLGRGVARPIQGRDCIVPRGIGWGLTPYRAIGRFGAIAAPDEKSGDAVRARILPCAEQTGEDNRAACIGGIVRFGIPPYLRAVRVYPVAISFKRKKAPMRVGKLRETLAAREG